MNSERILTIALISLLSGCSGVTDNPLKEKIIRDVRHATIERADLYLNEEPVTVSSAVSVRSAGGPNDFYSEGDYWWPDPENPDGPYIQKDGLSNPDVFSEHRHAMVRLSEITATLTSAYILTENRKYARKAIDHLNAWFTTPETMMNPHMLYAQAISGRVTGRGIGLIDAYHLVEVVQSIRVLELRKALSPDESEMIKNWFSRFLEWMISHPYGITEMNASNNHGTTWIVTAGIMARLTNNTEVTNLCIERFKNILLKEQMADDGSFPREMQRTKPYAYSLFNMDAFANAAHILSAPSDNLWEYETDNSNSLLKGMEFIYPFIADKSTWPFDKDVYIWEEWPVRQSCLLFAGLAYNNGDYIDLYLSLPEKPSHPEVIRNLPVRYPVIWLGL